MGFPRGMRRDWGGVGAAPNAGGAVQEQGHSEAEVACWLGVHRQSVNRWAKTLGAGEPEWTSPVRTCEPATEAERSRFGAARVRSSVTLAFVNSNRYATYLLPRGFS